jgi:cytoskeletal protein CcmA (bactofilin family)
MWKWTQDDKTKGAVPVHTPAAPEPPVALTAPVAIPREERFMPVSNPFPGPRSETAHIGKSVLVKGELSGSEDLYVDGEVEGTIELQGHCLTIGPNGRVRATLHAREVVIHGRITGNIRAVEKVELRRSANVLGDISTQRIAIEDGAFFKGGVDLQKPAPAPVVVNEPPVVAASPVIATKPLPGLESKTETVAAGAAPAAQSNIFDSGK